MPITLEPGTLEVITTTPTAVRALTDALPDAMVDARSGDGWSAREIVAHLLDRWNTQMERTRRILNESDPLILDEDETASLEVSGYRERPMMWLLDEFSRARGGFEQTIWSIRDEDLARTARHSVAGPFTLADMLNHVAYHDLLHVQQIAGTLALVPNAGRGASGMF